MNLESLLIVITLCFTTTAAACSPKGAAHTLYILSLAPFPDARPSFNPHYADSGAPGILPAVQLAVEHINTKTDLLCGYNLDYIPGDSGCTVGSKAIESVLRNSLHLMSSKSVVGVVGPVCSTAATRVASLLARDRVSLLHFTPAITPELSNSNFVNTIRALGTSQSSVEVFIRLVRRNNWSRIGSLIENERKGFQSTHDTFQTTVTNELGTSVLSLPVTESHINLEPFKMTQTRIIFLFMSADLTSRIMCFAHPKYSNLLYPTYQWVIAESVLRHIPPVRFYLDGRVYSCSTEEIEVVIMGTIVVAIHTATTADTLLLSGLTYRDYTAELQTRLSAANATQDTMTNVYYDGVFAIALALNRSSEHLERVNTSLSQYTIGQPLATAIIKEELLRLDFAGASGRVQFDQETNDGKPILVLYQIIQDQTVSSPRASFMYIGFYNTVDSSMILNGGSFLDSEFPLEEIKIHPAVGSVVFSLTALVFILTFSLHILTIVYRNVRSVKATSPYLNHLIFSGSYLFICATAVLILGGSFLSHRPSTVMFSVLCSSQSWCFSMGYSLVFGTVCVKSFRIYRFFRGFKRHSGKLLTDNCLISFVVALLSVDIAANVTWNLVSPWIVTEQEIIAEQKILIEAHCESNHLLEWLTAMLAPKLILTIIVIYLSVATRHINRKEFKHSKSINILAYSLVLLYCIGLPIAALFSSSLYVYTLSLCVIYLGTAILCLVTLSFQPLALVFVSFKIKGKRVFTFSR